MSVQIVKDLCSPRNLVFRLLRGGQVTWYFWGLQVFFWGGLAVLMFLISSVLQPKQADVRHVMLVRLFFGFLMSGILREVYRSSLLRRRQGWIKAMMVVASCLVLTSLEIPITRLMIDLNLPLPANMLLIGDGHPALLRFMVLLFWSAFYFMILHVKRAYELELRLLQSEVAASENNLRLLQAQMNPHFLFNALNTVLACKDSPEAVEEVTQSLADFLRFLLRNKPRLEPLALELDALESYLTVQRIRFGERLICKIGCDTAARWVMVPPLVIQPLLENAFKYGAETSPSPLQVNLTVKLEAGFLVVTVANTGSWVAPGGSHSTGIGLSSLEQQIKILIGDQATVYSKADDGWVYVTIRMPMNGTQAAELSRPS